MSIETDMKAAMERAVRTVLEERDRDTDRPDTLIGVDLDFVDRAGKKVNVGWVKVPCVPRIGDKFGFNHGDRWNPTAAHCVVTGVVFSNGNERDEFGIEVTITENQ